MTLVTLGSVGVEYGATTILSNVTWTIAPGDRWAVVGRNGAGKTSLLRVVTGAQAASKGQVARASGLTISVLDQHREYGEAVSVWDAAAAPLKHVLDLEHKLTEHLTRIGEAGDKVTDAQLDAYQRDLERFEQAGGYGLSAKVDAVLAGLGFDPIDARTRLLATLSGGERGRVGLIRQLVAPGDILMLDEPTNHLDLETSAWLEGWLREQNCTLVVVSHDRAFLRAVADHVLHVEQGTTFSYEGGYDHFVRQRAERRAAQQKAFAQQRKVIASEQDFIDRNIAGQKSSQAKGRRRRLDRVERLSAPPGEAGAAVIRFRAGSRGGDQVMVADRVSVSMGGRELLRAFSGVLRRGDVVGLIGPNGAGKSTLLKTIVGERAADAGAVTVPPAIAVSHYRQDLGDVDLSLTCYELIEHKRPTWTRGQIHGHLGKFDFPGEAALRKAGGLSGGERARMALALLELDTPNLLCFDEPTNHLDVETIEELEDAILDFDGTVLLISHDRDLLRSLTTRLWVLQNGRIEDFAGGFEEWEARQAQLKAEAQTAARLARDSQKPSARNTKPEARRSDEAQAERTRKRALDKAEKDVARFEGQVAELEQALADDTLYASTRGAAKAKDLQRELAAVRTSLADAMEAWVAASETRTG